jgi:hypothetical protein
MKHHGVDKARKGETVETYITHDTGQIRIQNVAGKPRRKKEYGEFCVDLRIVLKCILKQTWFEDVKWIHLI